MNRPLLRGWPGRASVLRFASWGLVALSACSTVVEEGADRQGPTNGPQVCAAPDAALATSFSVTAAAWTIEGEEEAPGGAPRTQQIRAACSVTSVASDAGGARISLSCSEGALVDQPVEVELSNLPSDFQIPIDSGSSVTLDYYWQSAGHHISSGHWLVLHDDSGSELLLSAIDHDTVSSAGDAIAPFDLDVDDSVCSPPCPANAFDCYEPTRVGVVVQGAGDERSVVADGTRARVELGKKSFDVVVSTAERYSCLNCSPIYTVLIGAR
jgi:hypothetical protein